MGSVAAGTLLTTWHHEIRSLSWEDQQVSHLFLSVNVNVKVRFERHVNVFFYVLHTVSCPERFQALERSAPVAAYALGTGPGPAHAKAEAVNDSYPSFHRDAPPEAGPAPSVHSISRVNIHVRAGIQGALLPIVHMQVDVPITIKSQGDRTMPAGTSWTCSKSAQVELTM